MQTSLLVLILSACGDEKAITINNTTPEAIITSHNDGDVAFTDELIEFRAAVSDANNPAVELEVQWTVGNRVACPFVPPDTDGQSICATTLSVGEDSIKVEVRDPNNATGTDSITLDLQESFPPSSSINTPTGNGVYYSDVLITFEGNVGDAEDANEDLVVTWESSLDGVLDLDTTVDSLGKISDVTYLSEGEHGIKLTVEDTSGKITTDQVTITVNSSNSPPSCEITAPASNSAGNLGTMIIFEGTATDENIPNNELTVTWKSSIDGEIGTSIPNSNGGVTFPYDALSVNTHIISMTVTDEIGESCVDDVIYTVGSPPTITITAPNNNDTFAQGENVTFVAEVTDNEDAASQLTVEWTSSLDGLFSTTGPNSSNIAQFTTSSLTAGAHSITVKATDSTGLYTDALFNVHINGIPSQPTVAITPNPARTGDVLVATASGSIDPEGNQVSYTYEWLLEGNATGNTGNTLSNGNTSKGQNWTVRATPSDGTLSGNPNTASITIGNTAPEITSITITPNPPSLQDVLSCNVSTSDVDNESVSVSYQWYINGNLQSSNSNSLSGPFQQNDTITCKATPNDGDDLGATVEDSVTITNAAPTITSVTLTPSSVYTNDIITAMVVASDSDGDPISYTWKWTISQPSGAMTTVTNTSSTSSDVLDGVGNFDKDDSVVLELIASDGNSTSSYTTTPIVILNTPPSAFNVVIDPIDPIAGVDDLTCVAQGSDTDGDSVSLSWTWTKNGNVTSFVDVDVPSSELINGDVWECVVTPDDGDDIGVDAATSVTIGANQEGAEGNGFCAAAGMTSDSNGNTNVSCLAEVGVAGQIASDGNANTWQPGSIFVYAPE